MPAIETQPLLLTTREAAALLRVSTRTLHSWTKRGLIKTVRIGWMVRYAPEDLRAFIEAQKVGAA